ncbi:MAG TPA: efflux transporter outer membrane subunit [Bryobacteraceae bacterium]|nr:efflux transporter outer membrane subunit [Bryobacteraceae bacterium]
MKIFRGPGGVVRAICFCAPVFLVCSCRVGPDYKRPPAPVTPKFKETPPAGWKESKPSDGLRKGKWWEIYNDRQLNALEEQVAVSNQNVKQAEALFQEARATVRAARSALFPTLAADLSAAAAGSGSSGGTPVSSSTGAVVHGASGTTTAFTLPFSASWEPDLWGAIRRTVSGDIDSAQSAAANVENSKLLFQSELAQDYFGIRGIDAQAELLTRTVASYEEFLRLTENRFNGGIASGLDISLAQTQLYAAQSQLIDLGVQRAAFEHGIAVLIGKPPAEVTIPKEGSLTLPPPVPVGVPSELLERRPDIASAERQVAAANEQIGVARAAYYPTLTLTGAVGFASSALTTLIQWPSRFWSVGASLAETLFDAGQRRAVVDQRRAAYDATVAAYRQTVLTAFQQVEDNLAALRVLQQESAKVDQTIQAARDALAISTVQYEQGTANYLTVITSQIALLNSQLTAVTTVMRRLTASVGLVEALGGGWDVSKLPLPREVSSRR